MHDLPLTQLMHRAGIIDLGWGHPDPALLPVELLRDAAPAALERWGADTLGYGPEPGAGPLREWLINHIARSEGRAPHPDELMITGGVSHALDQFCTLATQPGDIALVETPTYHLAMRILRDHPLNLVPIPTDRLGLNLDALIETLARLRRAGRRASFLYTVPTFHNPTGASLDFDRRAALVELAAEHSLLIIEDDVYRDLSYDGAPPASLWSIAPPNVVVRLGSFAKSLAPGLRLGWLTGDATLVRRFTGSGLLDSGGGVNHFTALVVAQACMGGGFDRHVTFLCDAYRSRRNALLAALTKHMPPRCSWGVPAGGFFVWVRLPGEVDADALLPRAEAAGVSYLPGARFHLDGSGTNTLRLAFSLYAEPELAEAARRLGEVVSAALKTRRLRI